VKYTAIMDTRVGGEVTDTDSVRAYMTEINQERSTNNAERESILANVRTESVPVGDIIWATNRFKQQEFIVRNPLYKRRIKEQLDELAEKVAKAFNPDEPSR
jgi:hypothetical protein